MFHNSPEPTRTEAERAFFIAMIARFGNVKMFILSISLAVHSSLPCWFPPNTMAMSIRERTREVAMMRSLGFAPRLLRALFLAETVTLAVCAWFFGTLAAYGLHISLSFMRALLDLLQCCMKIPLTTLVVSLPIAGF